MCIQVHIKVGEMIHYNSHSSIFSRYFFIFSFVTSYVIMGLTAATPSYVMAFTIPIFFLYKKNYFIIKTIIIVFFCIVVYYVNSQFYCYIFKVQLNQTLQLINDNTVKSTFRASHLTQHLYLIPGILTFIYIYFLYDEKFEKYIKYGLYLILVYGYIEWIIYLITGNTVEIFSNRTFGEDEASSSLIQTINIAGVRILRFKSLTGEPSMYAFSVLPYLSYFFLKKDYLLSFFIFLSLLLSTSSSAMIGIAIMILFYIGGELKVSIANLVIKKKFIIFIIFFILFLLSSINALTDIFLGLYAKLTLESFSGIQRFFLFINHINFWKELNIVNKFVGVGFGTIRSTDMFTTLLVNTGVIGILCYTIVFFFPFFKLNNNNKGLKIGMINLWIITLISVPEFSYLSLWIFVGLTYRQIKLNQIQKIIH